MKTASFRLEPDDETMPPLSMEPDEVDLLLVFGDRESLEQPYLIGRLHLAFPKAEIAGRAISSHHSVRDEGIQVLALSFGKVQIESMYRHLSSGDDRWRAGWETGREIDADDLKMVLLFGMDTEEAYWEVAEGMLEAFGPYPPLVCPGLAGDSLAPEGEVLLNSSGLYREGFLAVGIFGDRIEAEERRLREGRERMDRPVLKALHEEEGDAMEHVVKLHEVAA